MQSKSTLLSLLLCSVCLKLAQSSGITIQRPQTNEIWYIGSKNKDINYTPQTSGNFDITIEHVGNYSVEVTVATGRYVSGGTADTVYADIPWTVGEGSYVVVVDSGATLDLVTISIQKPSITFYFSPASQTRNAGDSVMVGWNFAAVVTGIPYDANSFKLALVSTTGASTIVNNQVAVESGVSHSATITIPAAQQAGTYFFELQHVNGYVSFQSPQFTVATQTNTPSKTLNIQQPPSGSSYAAGNTIQMSWTSSGFTSSDQITIALYSGTALTATLGTINGQSPGAAFTIPNTVAGGTYNLRISWTGGFTQTSVVISGGTNINNGNNNGNNNNNGNTNNSGTTSNSNTTVIIIAGSVSGGVVLIGSIIAAIVIRRRNNRSSSKVTALSNAIIIGPDGKPQVLYSPVGLGANPLAAIARGVSREAPQIGSPKRMSFNSGHSPITSKESTRSYRPIADEDLTNESFASLPSDSVILGRFRLKGVALSGGTASVRLATDEKTDKKVAIKLTNAYQEAVNELKVLKAIRSPYVVSLEDTYEVPQLSAPLIVMEHLDKSLSEFVRSKQLDTPAIKMIFSQIVAGVEHIHSANFVHCDLKPQNIMLCSADVQWKIIDFGNTKQALTDDINGLTPMYCPPEVARAVLANRPIKAHPSVDMWQLGVILYYMYTRRLPFEDVDDERAILSRLASRDFAPELNGIGDNQAKNLLSKLFVDDPKKRLALDKLKRSAYLNSGLDTMQVETAASANAGVLAEKLSNKLDAISEDVKQVKDLSKQALGQIVAARRQVFEHQEYKCPRLVLMLPKNSKQVSAWNPKKWFTDSFLLFLLCEHDDCVHFTDHPGYELTEPKDFVRKAAPILSKTLLIASVAVSAVSGGTAVIPPSIFTFLSSASKSSALTFLTSGDEQTKAKQAAEYLGQVHGLLAPVVEEQIEAGADVSKLIGSSLREMQVLLHELDPRGNWGGLQAVSTPDGQVRYVCPKHAKQYYIHQA